MYLFFFLLYFFPSFLAQSILQSPPALFTYKGRKVHLKCTVQVSSDPYMYWYRKTTTADLTFISYSFGKLSVEEITLSHFNATRSSETEFSLSSDNIDEDDAGIYYCAWSHEAVGSSAAYFGSGTVVSVLEKDETIKGPKVSIYRPSKQELEDHSFISLVCVASNFFPEHVKIRWFVNNEERINLYEPVAQKKSDNTYSTSKRLTLTRSEYFSPDSEFRCEAAFLDGTEQASAKIKGETDCGVSKETYTSSINVGKVSYIMVLCKSGLYALVVLVLVWRKKVIASSY